MEFNSSLRNFTKGITLNSGVYPVIQTPLDDHDQIDEVVFEAEINWLIKSGVKGLVLAMVSEVMRFSAAERRNQWQIVLRILDGRLPLIVSVGGESTAIAVQLAKDAESDGAAALMATPPSSFPATSFEIRSKLGRVWSDITSDHQTLHQYNVKLVREEKYDDIVAYFLFVFDDFLSFLNPHEYLITLQRLDQLHLFLGKNKQCMALVARDGHLLRLNLDLSATNPPPLWRLHIEDPVKVGSWLSDTQQN